MIEIGVAEAQNTLVALIQQVERGEEVFILSQGSPVAKLISAVPATSELTEKEKAESRAAGERIRARAMAAPRVPFNWDEVKADLGRKY